MIKCLGWVSLSCAVAKLFRVRIGRWVKFALRQCCVLLAVTTASLTQASELEPIGKRLDKIPNWTEDRTELGYITLRCGVLLFSLSEIFLSDTRKIEEIVKRAERVREASTKLIDQGIVISRSVGLSDQIIDRRVAQLSKSYGDSIANGRALHNDIFRGLIGEDFQFCRQLI